MGWESLKGHKQQAKRELNDRRDSLTHESISHRWVLPDVRETKDGFGAKLFNPIVVLQRKIKYLAHLTSMLAGPGELSFIPNKQTNRKTREPFGF